MTRIEAQSYPISIFMAGSLNTAFEVCLKYCDEAGYCVTLHGTGYIYRDRRGGRHDQGFVVGLINYPRFPEEPEAIWARAETLAELLREACEEDSYTIQAPDKTVWFSIRDQG